VYNCFPLCLNWSTPSDIIHFIVISEMYMGARGSIVG
jgi:hypothetical protein